VSETERQVSACQVTACVVSYHNGRHTLTLLVDNKLQIMGVSSKVLGALSRGAVEALAEENRETKDANRTLQNAAKQDRLWLNGAIAAIDPLCGGMGAATTAAEIWRKHIGDIRPEPEHLKSKQGDV
jgi:hypothetical protein